MRILQISSARSFGGGEKHLADLVTGLLAHGNDVFLAAPENSPLREKLPALPYENFITLDICNALDISAARKMAAVIREKDIDIIHAHVARDYIPAALAARLRSKTKLVLTRHVLFPMKTLQRFALANVSRVIAVSSAVAKELSDSRIFPAGKVVIIPNGIDIPHWSKGDKKQIRNDFRRQHNISADALVIGTVGELKKLKGQEDFLLAAELVLQDFPDAQFIVVGRDNSPDRAYRERLHKLAAAIGAEKNFIWLDWVDDTAPLLHAIDIFVSASHSESFGLAILEAMSAGCPLISTATEGARELVGDIDTVPVEQPVKLAEAIVEMVRDGEKRREQTQFLQARAKELFDVSAMINKTEKLYGELIR